MRERLRDLLDGYGATADAAVREGLQEAVAGLTTGDTARAVRGIRLTDQACRARGD